jgi:hypothetical protein
MSFICREKKHTARPSESEIILFVNEALTMQILKRWLNATNLTELKARNSLHTLQRFVRRTFIVNYNSRDTETTKTLDSITKDIVVPSRSGKNFSSNLQL